MAARTPDLDRAVALIAAAGRPEVDPAALLGRLDELASTSHAGDAAGLCVELFGPHGFRGDTVDYHDPANSLLDRVLDRRTGIPITLAIVAIEVGRRRDIELLGIGMPGHFLLRDARSTATFFDPFDGGVALDAQGCQRVFARLHGAQQAFHPEFLDPTPTRAIVVRVLNNLLGAYTRLGDREGVARTLGLQVVVPGAGVAVRRQLAGVLAADGQFLDAARTHDQLAVLDPEHAEDHERAAHRLRAQLN